MNLKICCVDEVENDLHRLSTGLDNLIVKFFEFHSVNEGDGEIKLVIKPSQMLIELTELVERLNRSCGDDG